MTHEGRITTGWRMRAGVLGAIGVALAGGSLRATAAVGPDLGAARSFAVLAHETVTNTDTATVVTGDLGVSPGSAIDGFPPGTVVDGAMYVGGEAPADAAIADATNAYNFLAGMAQDTNYTGVDLGTLAPLGPGVYRWDGSAQLTGDLVLDAGGDSGAVFIFQIATTLTTASGATVTVINGGGDYDESGIYWQIGSSATLGSGTAFLGHILAFASITMNSGTSMVGNALAINGAVTLDFNSVTSPALILPLPDPPVELTAAPIGLVACDGMDLEWRDASDNETEFRVYRRDGAGPDFVLVGTVVSTDTPGTGAGGTFQDLLVPESTTLTYRVTAFSPTDGESVPSDEALVETCDSIPPEVLAPINLTAALNVEAASPGADLSWNDASDNETEFRVYRRDGSGPDFLQVGTVVSTDTPGDTATVTFQDLILDFSMTFTYRVTAFRIGDGGLDLGFESAPSNEALVTTADAVPPIPPPTRWVDVDLGRRRSFIRDRNKPGTDRFTVKGSYSVIDIDTGIPTVLDDADPRIGGISIQVRAPGNILLLAIPAEDTGWKVWGNGAIYHWRTRDGKNAPLTCLTINTRTSEFTFRSRGLDFGPGPVNDITVSLTTQGATGSDTQTWDTPTLPANTRALFTRPR